MGCGLPMMGGACQGALLRGPEGAGRVGWGCGAATLRPNPAQGSCGEQEWRRGPQWGSAAVPHPRLPGELLALCF